MRHGAERRDPEPFFGEHRRGAGKSHDIARARRHHAGLGAVCPAQPEIDQRLVGRREPHARGLGGDQRLKMQNVDKPGFDQLRLRQRRRDPQDRLVGEEYRAFRHRMHVAAKAQRREIVEHAFPEPTIVRKPIDLAGREAQILQKVERLFETRRHQELPPGGKRADEKLKDRGLRMAVVQVGLDHVELIKVGEQRGRNVVHAGA